MRILSALSDLMVPVLIFYVVGLGLLMKQDVFGDFLNGAKDGMRTVIGIVPTLIGLMAAVGVLRSSKKEHPPLRFSPEKQVSPNYLYLILITF